MSVKERLGGVSLLGSQSSRKTEIMNAKLENKSRKKRRKLKISKALFGLAARKSPEIAPVVSRKRGAKERVNFDREMKPSITCKPALNRTPPSGDSPVPDRGTSVQDVFVFPSGSVRRKSTDVEVKQSVLKTMSRMLEENRAIRQRWLTLSQKS